MHFREWHSHDLFNCKLEQTSAYFLCIIDILIPRKTWICSSSRFRAVFVTSANKPLLISADPSPLMSFFRPLGKRPPFLRFLGLFVTVFNSTAQSPNPSLYLCPPGLPVFAEPAVHDSPLCQCDLRPAPTRPNPASKPSSGRRSTQPSTQPITQTSTLSYTQSSTRGVKRARPLPPSCSAYTPFLCACSFLFGEPGSGGPLMPECGGV